MKNRLSLNFYLQNLQQMLLFCCSQRFSERKHFHGRNWKGDAVWGQKFIFDGTNSSNLNFVAQKIRKEPKNLKFSVIPGNKNIIEELSKYPDKIGVIGLNTFSRPYDKESEELRSMIKILPVEYQGKLYNTDFENLRKMNYPFTRILYFNKWG